ncbi:MAG TPA: hypothetical protein VFD81_13995 [Methylomirabilota bacterium]|nr:hypothetical protein [Methylomirabilota bacterium]
MTEASQQFLTVAEATRECARHDADLSEATLKRAADRGELPCIRTTGRGVRLFKLEDVRAFAKARLA